GARAHGVDARGRDHGRPAPQVLRRGRAVPPGVDPHPRGQAAAGELPRPARERRGVTPRAAIARLVEGRHLSEAETAACVEHILRAEVGAAEVAGFLVALRMKGETVDELRGAVHAL